MFSIKGTEITQGIQYYHSKDSGIDPQWQCPDNSLPLVAHKQTVVRVYLESSGSPTKPVNGTLLAKRKVGANGEWTTLGPLNALGPSAPTAPGTAYKTERGSLNSSVNFCLPSGWVAGELSLDIQLTDGAQTLKTLAMFEAKLRQTLKIAAIMVQGDLGGTKVPPPTFAGLVKTAFKAPRIMPISDEIQFRVAGTITVTEKLYSDSSWESLKAKALPVRDADGCQPGWIYYVLIPPSLLNTDGPLGMEWGDVHFAAGRALEVDEGYDAIVHEIGHACGRLHAPAGTDKDLDPKFPHYTPYREGVTGDWGLDVVEMKVIGPEATDIMGYGDYPTGWTIDKNKYVQWISPYTYRALYNNPRLNPQPAEWPNEIFRGRWTTGWTTIVTCELGGKPHLFSYKAGDGSVAIDRIRDDGLGTTGTFTGRWTTGWTTIVPFLLGGKPHLFSYKAGDGSVAIDRVLDAGNGTANVLTAKWTAGWTNIVAVQLNGKPHLFSYKADGGDPLQANTAPIALDRIKPDGKGTTTLFTSRWFRGWTNIKSFQLGGKPCLLSYKAGEGSVGIDRVNG